MERGNSVFNKTHYRKMYETSGAKEVSSSDSDEEEAEEVLDENDLDTSWTGGADNNDNMDDSECWMDLYPPTDNPIKYEHPVRELPKSGAKVVGVLVPGMAVQAQTPKNVRAGGGLGAGRSKSRFKGPLLYTGGVLFHVECCIIQL
jgi:hypothetical protein